MLGAHLHAKLSIRSFSEHVENDANVVDGFSREAEADELAQGWDAFRAEVPLAASRSECRSKRSQSFLGLFEREGPGTDKAVLELRCTLPALAVRVASCMRAHRLTLSVYVMLCGTSTSLRRPVLVFSCLHSV